MTLRFRDATRADVPAVMALLADDALGAQRETATADVYLAGFDAMAAEPNSHIVVGEDDAGRIVATFHLTFLRGLSHRAARRAQIESVRVEAGFRGQGLGAALMAEAETRARAAGCSLMQLTTHTDRKRAHAFYDRLGYQATHIGYKKPL
jgi:GNAT superfamily N-acetyltransferase